MAIEWTDEQKAILAQGQTNSARVLAGPGTGKSATMVEWIGRILDQDQTPRVKLLTFTRAATAELAQKVTEHQTTAALRPSTVHSFAISVLLRNPGVAEFPQPLRIADDWERKNIVHRTLGRRIGVRSNRIGNLFTELAANWEALEDRQNPRVDPQERARFLAGWQEHRQVFGYTHLGELPWALRRAIQNHPDLTGLDYDLLVVDEYQDLNACDLEVLRLLSERGIGVVGIGDDDQSIYSFRRAAPEGIRRFLQDYPNAADYPLSITHRCGATIMDWAGNVIARDLGRDTNKPMPTPSEGSPDGEVALLAFATNTAEPNGIAEIVDHLIDRENIDPPRILILLRSDYNEQFSKPIKAALEARGIAYADPNEVTNALAQPDNRIILASFRLLSNRSDSLAWATLIELTPGIGNAFVSWIYAQARDEGLQFGEKLLEEFEDGFSEGPSASRTKAWVMVESLLQWADNHQIPEEQPEDGWVSG